MLDTAPRLPVPQHRSLHVAVVGAGPAGIYATDMLRTQAPGTRVDLFERLPAPYGLVRYGVAPDHPAIKRIVDSLHVMLDGSDVRVYGGVHVGVDITLDRLATHYDAVVVATGADTDAVLDVPGVDLPGSFGAADFVSWYDGHPDAPPTWPLTAQEIAVVGAGNVALDLVRMLVKHPDDLLSTDIHDAALDALRTNQARTVHLFARRGPADTRFSAKELRELGEQTGVEVVVDPADVALDAHAERVMAQSAQRRLTAETLVGWSRQTPDPDAARRIHIHLFEAPSEILGADRVEAFRTERTVPDGLGHVTGSGTYRTYPVQAVYRAVGYRSTPVDGLPFDLEKNVVPSLAGRVVDEQGRPVPGRYVTGWVRRGPVGLIGSTRSDAAQTVASLLADHATSGPCAHRDPAVVEGLLRARGVTPVDWAGWLRIDGAERAAGAAAGRDRVKISTWSGLTEAAETTAPDGRSADGGPEEQTEGVGRRSGTEADRELAQRAADR